MYWSAGRLPIGWAKARVVVVVVTDDDVTIGSSISGGGNANSFQYSKH